MSRRSPCKHTKKLEFPLHRLYLVVAVLLLAVLGTSLWTTTVMAKYVTSTTGSDGARVARFDVEVEAGNTQNAAFALALPSNQEYDPTEWDVSDITDPDEAKYSFTVTSKSEVTVTYDVVVTFPDALPAGVTLRLTNGSKTIDPTTVDDITYTFSEVGTFDAGEAQSDELTLTFVVGNEAMTGGVWENVQIDVYAAQVD